MASPQFLRSPSFPISGDRPSSPRNFQPPLSPRGGSFTVSASCASAERTRTTYTSNSLYEVLGIPAGASGDEIKSAYRKLARICHPDVAKDSSGNDFIKIHNAYSTLADPEKRADYDRNLSPRFRSVGLSVSVVRPAARYATSRNWETDQCW